jgi:hypothetical protein
MQPEASMGARRRAAELLRFEFAVRPTTLRLSDAMARLATVDGVMPTPADIHEAGELGLAMMVPINKMLAALRSGAFPATGRRMPHRSGCLEEKQLVAMIGRCTNPALAVPAVPTSGGKLTDREAVATGFWEHVADYTMQWQDDCASGGGLAYKDIRIDLALFEAWLAAWLKTAQRSIEQPAPEHADIGQALHGSQKVRRTVPVAELHAWFRARVATWPSDRRHPSREQDVADARAYFGGYILPVRMVHTARKELAPETWQQPGQPKKSAR